MESDRDLKPAIQVGMIVPGSMESMGINVIEICKQLEQIAYTRHISRWRRPLTVLQLDSKFFFPDFWKVFPF